MNNEHSYALKIVWSGKGTESVQDYDRSYVLSSESKVQIVGSADPSFRGDPKKWNPEEMLVAALASCHMLSYLYRCSTKKINVQSYEDNSTGLMILEKGVGKFKEVVLNPIVVITDSYQITEAEKLHEQAHHDCFIANSVNFTVRCVPTIRVG